MPVTRSSILAITALAVVAAGIGTNRAVADDRSLIEPSQIEFFEKHIRPVLIEHCLECHRSDGDELAGNLALDSAAAIRSGGDSGAAIVPGDPDASPLIEAMRYDGLEMPPSGKLPDEVIHHFEQWVRTGAADPRDGAAPATKVQSGIDLEAGRAFWAFQPRQVASPPEGNGSPNSAIDRFLTARRNTEDLPNPEQASPAIRLRRLAYDLTGLPPSREQLNSFLADPSEEHWSRIVDEYLASPSFGEHWSRMWLDAARYADSNGSDFNATYHDAWRYRNYVIDSYNADRPFSEFVTQQLAGDLLPYDTDSQRTENLVATTFLALGAKMLSERDKDKLALDIVDEQIDTVGKTFLGMTLGCARCHDHKFDPVSTRDYYGLAGIFQSTETIHGEMQQYVSDLVRVELPVSPEVAAAVASYEVRKKQLEARKKKLEKELEQLRTSASLDAWLKLGVVVDNTAAVLTGQWKESTLSPSRLGDNYIHNDMRSEAMTATYAATLPAEGEYEVRVSYSAAGTREAKVPVSIETADGTVEVFVDQRKQPKLANVLQPIGRFVFGNTTKVVIGTQGTSGYVIADAVQFVPVDKADATPPTAADDKQLVEARKEVEQSLKELESNAPEPLPTALAIRDFEKPADCAIRIRGEAHREGQLVPRGFLEVAMTSEPPSMPADQSGRLQLAEWIASADNPLTARVYVNRVWQNLFGQGIVLSPHNFGQLGDRPSHPELLDWLAQKFIDDGWSTKSLVRHLVLSTAYQAVSEVPTEAAAIDPNNRLLSHANRRTLTVEQLRDTLLQCGNALDRSRTIDPMKGIGKLVSNNTGGSTSAKSNASTMVRTVYLPIIRNELPEVLTTFDFADPEVSVGKRSQTNVPSQALYLMNSKFVQEMAANLAKTVMNEDDPISAAYESVLRKQPSTDAYSDLYEFVAGYESQQDGLTALCHVLFSSTEFRVLE